MPPSDHELITSYKNGDLDALRVLIERYTDHIYNFTYKLGAKEEASDITQEVFLKVWKNLKKFDPEKASFKTWIFTIARNTTTDYLRKKKNIVFSDIDTGEDDSHFSETIADTHILPPDAFEKMEDIQTLKEAVSSLSPDYRSVLTLYYENELTFDEIGKILNKPLNTVKSWHRRALIKLRELL